MVYLVIIHPIQISLTKISHILNTFTNEIYIFFKLLKNNRYNIVVQDYKL